MLCNKLLRNYKEILEPARRSINELKLRKFSNNDKTLELYKEIADIKEQRHVISVMHGKGFLSEEKYQEQINNLDTKLLKANQSLRKITKSDDEDNTVAQLDVLIDTFEKMTEDTNIFEPAMFSLITDKMTVIDNEKIEFQLIGGMRFTERIVRK